MNTCKTCKHWDRGECALVHWIWHYKDPVSTLSGITVYVDAPDDQGLEVTLTTHPDFGCIHHLEKQNATL